MTNETTETQEQMEHDNGPEPNTPPAVTPEDTAWENATESKYISFRDKPVQIITFMANQFKTTLGQNGEPQFEFDVIDTTGTQRLLSTQSVRLMHALKAIRPLEGKKVKIMRTGDGYATQYTAAKVV